ncbi:MAG: carbohydrate-binding protein, partial [Armatimonadota bacterium]|nr:carbohydrate-binding protein [Armatimonadota bacterium]
MKLRLIFFGVACAVALAVPAHAASDPSGVRVQRTAEGINVTTSLMEIDYSLTHGLWDAKWAGGQAIRGASCEVKLSDGTTLRAGDYPPPVCGAKDVAPVQDVFGRGIVLTIHHRAPGKPELRQRLWIYKDVPYLFTDLQVISATPISTNDISPFLVGSPELAGGGLFLNTAEKPRTLFVPFDNDMWVRYNSDYASNSYEVTAVYDNESRHGFVLGSVTHDVWKTGFEIAPSQPGFVGRLRANGGATGLWTHDSQPHGMVSGTSVASPRLFIGYFPDWRDGLESFGQANGRLSPPLPWSGGVPFGWNSWAAYGFGINNDRYLKVADFFKDRLQARGFQNNGTVYINLDSGWNAMSEAQLVEAVRHIHANGQKAGIYWTPFTYWSDDLTRPVDGVPGTVPFRDILLKDGAGNP